AATVGQQITISSEDPVLHNTHPQNSETNATIYNIALPYKGFSVTKPLPATTELIKVKCDAHMSLGVRPSLLCDHWRRRQIHDQGCAARYLHSCGMAGSRGREIDAGNGGCRQDCDRRLPARAQ